jgi:hypothetical protein
MVDSVQLIKGSSAVFKQKKDDKSFTKYCDLAKDEKAQGFIVGDTNDSKDYAFKILGGSIDDDSSAGKTVDFSIHGVSVPAEINLVVDRTSRTDYDNAALKMQ